MTKKHFIALADAIRRSRVAFTDEQLRVLADFCRSENGMFNEARWLGYLRGENGPNGGEVKTRSVPASEIAACPQHRLDPRHYIPRHRTEECGG